ncbi:hypothetical protein [Luteolibacter marinus]|uniref:hypothetical protein n=1 Tax=Luteolibacter marinus TaxID=2776705 RepID=UPI00186602DB|nr:hypothetical protein [Luteolibacter marinus]
MKICPSLTLFSTAALLGTAHATLPLVDGTSYPDLFGPAGDVTVTPPPPGILDLTLGGTATGTLGDHWDATAAGGARLSALGVTVTQTGAQVALTGDELEFRLSNAPSSSLLGALGVGTALDLSWSATATFDDSGNELTLQPNSVYRVSFDVDGGGNLLNSTLGIAPSFGIELLDGSGASIGYSGGGTVANILGIELIEIIGAPAGSGTATVQFQTGETVPAGAGKVRFTASAALPSTVLGIGTDFATVSNLEVTYIDPYTLWIEDTGLTDEEDRLPDADPDGDGRNNIEEFALATDPEVSDVPVVYSAVGNTNAGGPPESVFVMTTPVRSGAEFSPDGGDQIATQDGANYRVEGSFELLTWEAAVTEVSPNNFFQVGLPELPEGWEYRSFRVPGQTTDTPRAFLRVRVD